MISNAALRIELRPSRRGLLAGALLHTLVALALGLSAPPLWLGGLAWLAWGLSLTALWRAARRPLAITGLLRDSRGWQLQRASGGEPAELLPQRVVTPAVMVLQFRLHRGGRLRCVLWPDSAAAEDLRRLRQALLTDPV